MQDSWEKGFPHLDEGAIRKFAECIGDDNPLHHDDEAARQAGLLGIVAPGIMLTGFVSSAIASEIPRAMVRQLQMKFIQPLYAGSSPTVSCSVEKHRGRIAQVAVMVRNGYEILAEGMCTLLLPV